MRALKDATVAIAFSLTVILMLAGAVMLFVVAAEQFGWIEWGWVCDPNDLKCEQGYRNPK